MRYGQKPPPENAGIKRVSSGAQRCQDRTSQDGDHEMKHILFPGDRQGVELDKTAKRCANRG
jgi:hypothetical protein